MGGANDRRGGGIYQAVRGCTETLSKWAVPITGGEGASTRSRSQSQEGRGHLPGVEGPHGDVVKVGGANHKRGGGIYLAVRGRTETSSKWAVPITGGEGASTWSRSQSPEGRGHLPGGGGGTCSRCAPAWRGRSHPSP